MVELVYTGHLKCPAERIEGSSPSRCTNLRDGLMKKYTKDEIDEAIKATVSMAGAAAKLGCHISTFSRFAKKYGLYSPNKGRAGHKRSKEEYSVKFINLDDILKGLHPQYQSYKLKKRLYDVGLKENICEQCGISEWNGLNIECELDHIDGNSKNHLFSNLRILCPNCHSQTPTFRFKKRK